MRLYDNSICERQARPGLSVRAGQPPGDGQRPRGPSPIPTATWGSIIIGPTWSPDVWAGQPLGVGHGMDTASQIAMCSVLQLVVTSRHATAAGQADARD